MSSDDKKTGPGHILTGRGPAFWAAAGLHLALAGLLAFVPLFNLLGYEFAAVFALLASATAGPVAIGLLRRTAGDPPWTRTWARAVGLNGALLAGPLLIMLLNAWRVQNCNLPVGLLFFVLLPLLSAIWSTSLGLAAGLLTSGRWRAGLIFAGLWSAVALWNITEAYLGPQMDSYNQIVGWVAGPIYDDVIEPGWPLVFSRAMGLAAAGFLLAAAAALRSVGAARRRALALLAATGPLALGLFLAAGALGFGRSTAIVRGHLSAETVTRHFVIHHRPELNDADAALLARDHEFRLHQIERDLGPVDLPPIHSWVFPSAADKRRWVGASRTQYAKPWLASMCLNSSTFPHPTLKHELVHVVAGGFGSWPLAVSSRAALWMNPGLIEGLAVAVDWPVERFDRHSWSAALRRIGKAPPMEALFGSTGFWSAAAGRSYTMAGSFVRYLLDTYGPAPLRVAYAAGGLEGVYPKDTAGLIADWSAFLDALDLDPGTLEVARLRFSSPSVFKRTCAHEMAALRKRCVGELGDERFDEADATVDEILAHLPADHRAQELRLEIRVRQKRLDEAAAMAERMAGAADRSPADRARLAGRYADLLLAAGRRTESRPQLETFYDAHLSEGDDRLALVKLQALDRGQAGVRVLGFLHSGRLEAFTLLDLQQAALEQPDWGSVPYLIGRQLFNRGHFGRAIAHFERAARIGLGHPLLNAENLRLLALAHHRAWLDQARSADGPLAPGVARGDPARALSILAVLGQYPAHRGQLADVRDWLERLHFDRSAAFEASTRRH